MHTFPPKKKGRITARCMVYFWQRPPLPFVFFPPPWHILCKCTCRRTCTFRWLAQMCAEPARSCAPANGAFAIIKLYASKIAPNWKTEPKNRNRKLQHGATRNALMSVCVYVCVRDGWSFYVVSRIHGKTKKNTIPVECLCAGGYRAGTEHWAGSDLLHVHFACYHP